MKQERKQKLAKKAGEEVEETPASQASEVSEEETARVLSEIDEVLEELEIEEKRRYREKLKSLNFWGRRAYRSRTGNCEEVVSVPESVAELLLSSGDAKLYDGPPCVGCD